MTRTQYRAECSCCGRTHAVSGVRVAKHGYTVPTGWHMFIGQCSGSGRAHFGTVEGRDYRASIAAGLRETAAGFAKHALDVRAGTRPVQAQKRVPDSSRHGYSMQWITIESPTTWQTRDFIESLERSAERNTRAAREMQATIDAWQAREPVAVTIEQKPATVHFRVTRYGSRFVGACVASAMGAQRFAGQTTEDMHAVTCERCKKDIARVEAIRARKAAQVNA